MSPSRSASSSRRNASIPPPSPIIVPSAAAENGRQCPDADIAGVLLKHMYMKIVFSASTPPVITRSLVPSCSSPIPMCSAASELAHAASVTQLVPPRLKRFATRPATTLPRQPGNVFSFHSGNSAVMRFAASCTCVSGIPARRMPSIHIGRVSRPDIELIISVADATPRITLVRSSASFAICPPEQSSSTCRARISARICAISVDGSMFGGSP